MILHPGPERNITILSLRQDTKKPLLCLLQKIFIPGKNSELYFQELKGGSR
jgi:hypothetical protein